jgi:hypothetical protein
MKYPGFIGPAYQLDAYSADSQESVNLYPEKVESGTGKSEWILKGTPGIDLWITGSGIGPIRGMLQTDTGLYYVSTDTLYRRNTDGTTDTIGAVGTDVGDSPVFIHANGTQLLVVSAGDVWSVNGSTLAAVTWTGDSGKVNVTPPTASSWWSQVDWVNTAGSDKFLSSWVGKTVTIDGTPHVVRSVESDTRMWVTGLANGTNLDYSSSVPTEGLTSTYLGGYGIVNPPNSKIFYISRLHDFTKWDASDYETKEGYADNIARVFSDGQYLWLFGYETTEIWAHTGAADFPFERLPGGFMQIGCAARWAVNTLAGGVAFIGRDSRGIASAYMTQGLRPTRISTHAIEQEWASYSDITDATAYTRFAGGHEFWEVTFHAANKTWVYDATTGAWHRRTYNNTDRLPYITHAYWVSQKLEIVGSRIDNKLYLLSDSYTDDDGTAITRTRTAPHIAEENKTMFHHALTLDMQMGTKSGGGAGSVTMNYSNNGGRTWSTDRAASTGAASAWTTRAVWRRLGRSRDRVYRVKISDAQKVTLTGAYLEISPGLQ